MISLESNSTKRNIPGFLRMKFEKVIGDEHFREREKQVVVDSSKVVCGFVSVRRKNPKSEWWNDEVKGAVEKKIALWKDYERKTYGNLYKGKKKGSQVHISKLKGDK